MNTKQDILNPSKQDRKTAKASYEKLYKAIENLTTDNPELEIEETGEKIEIPISVLKFFAKLLEEISLGKPVSIVPVASELTTQAAAEYLGCSRPHVVKLLEEDKMPYTKVGKHRRIKFEDLVAYKKGMKANQKDLIIEMMKDAEELGL